MKRPVAFFICGMALSVPSTFAVTFINSGFNDNAAQYLVWPGYSGSVGTQGIATNPEGPTGWIVTGGSGINSDAVVATDTIVGDGGGIGGLVNPFIDNGNETDAVLLLQGVATAAQTVGGFTIGQDYILSLDVNARNCCGDVPQGQLSIGGSIVIPYTSINPVGADTPYTSLAVPFTATSTSIDFLVETRAAAGGDATLLLDNFAITVVPEPSSLALLLATLGIAARRRRGC